MSTAASAYALPPPGELVERYAPLVKKIANHLLGRLPEGVAVEDLVQTGLIALLDAARQYSAAKGASFETYASIRVRGAMLDEFRNTDWAPRSVYRKQRRLTAAIRAVESRTRAHARPREIAEELNLKEIGEILGVTESRVCQIHGQALARLRAQLQDWHVDCATRRKGSR
jgi:RNA polymerase sigma factor for flagellar operon FliA